MKLTYFSASFSIFLLAIFSNPVLAQWSGDGYFLDNGQIWGTYETVIDQNNFGGVYYRIKHASGTIINVVPVSMLEDGRLYLRWTQYRTFQKNWYTEYSGEMVVSETLLPLTSEPRLGKTKSPAGILLEGIFAGQIRTLLKYVGGTPYPSETAWAPISFTINGGGVTATAFNPFAGLLEGYVLSTNGNILGDYVLYREPDNGGWGCLNGQYLHYYYNGGNYLAIICPTEFDLNTSEVKGIFYRYRVNASNLDRRNGIWRVNEWRQDIAGEVKFFRVPSRCPDNAPERTSSGYAITGCIHAQMKTTYKYISGRAVEAREAWFPILFTLTEGSTTAPGPITGDPCDDFCRDFCQGSGRYNGSTICMFNVVSEPARGCSCDN